MSSSKNPKENIRKVFLVTKYFYWIIFRFRPHQNADPSRPRVAAVIDTLISFKNNDLGAWIRGGDIIIKNSGWDISLARIQFVLVWQFAPSLPVNRGWENKRRMSSQQKTFSKTCLNILFSYLFFWTALPTMEWDCPLPGVYLSKSLFHCVFKLYLFLLSSCWMG